MCANHGESEVQCDGKEFLQSGKYKPPQLEDFIKRSVNFGKFKPDLSDKDFTSHLTPIDGLIIFPWTPIETLSCTKTIRLQPDQFDHHQVDDRAG